MTGFQVIAHNEYHVAGPKIAFDVYHFVDGLVVEHWDNLQAKPDTVNPSRRSMTDGPVEAKKLTLAETEANKAIAKSFVNDILRDGKVDRLAGYFHCDDYIQHNPAVADGVSTFAAARNSTSWNLKYNRVRFTLGDGDFVLVASEGSVAGSPTGFYDLFRLENGKLAEHWDVVEPIPPRDKWVNNNAKFWAPTICWPFAGHLLAIWRRFDGFWRGFHGFRRVSNGFEWFWWVLVGARTRAFDVEVFLCCSMQKICSILHPIVGRRKRERNSAKIVDFIDSETQDLFSW